jgi:5-methylcytosine-specific restriction endonuclease McrA
VITGDKISSTKIPEPLRARVAERSKHRCCYCHAREAIMGIRLHIDHIVPEKAGGISSGENLCLACQSCNRSKWQKTHSTDPVSNQIVRLFNPKA